MQNDDVRLDVTAEAQPAEVLQGPFRRYHPDGSLAREGTYVEGQLDGLVVAYASVDGRGAPLRGCCVPVGAARMEARYEQGALRGETFFDMQGHPLLSNGERRPPRPQAVPEQAWFDESSRRWYHGAQDGSTGRSLGTWTWWTGSGALCEEIDHHNGRQAVTRRFDDRAQLVESTSYLRRENDDDGYELVVHGPWRRRLDADELGLWGGTSAMESGWVEGHFHRTQSVGVWTLKTVQGETVWTRDLGLPVDESVHTSSPAFADDTRSAAEWMALAESLQGQQRVREALVAQARALCGGADVSAFVASAKARVLPRSYDDSEMQGALEKPDRSVVTLLEALVGGANSMEVLRALSTAVSPWTYAARDLSEACVLLNPDDQRCILTRAFVRLERADDHGLQVDLDLLSKTTAEPEQFFRETLAIFRPTYAFDPPLVPLPPLDGDVSLNVAQPLSAVVAVARIYAARLASCREALARFGASDRAWAPPLLAAFLANPPVVLRKEAATIADQDESGALEETVVQIDETLDLQGLGVSAIIHRARADWQGLCWLLWAVGMDEVAVPTQVQTAPTYAEALSLAVQRAWRARDQVVTSGLRSMTQGVPAFDWQGRSIADLPPSLLDVCIDECIEARAVLLWLSNEGNISPFQDDLRRV